MISTEKISVNIPHQGFQLIEVAVRPDEGDDEIALRMVRSFPEGTILGIAGVKWRIVSREPPKVEEVTGNGSKVQPEPAAKPSRGLDLTCRKPNVVGLIHHDQALISRNAQQLAESLAEPKKTGFDKWAAKKLKSPSFAKEYRDARGPQPGEVWRPRDPRRKASFTIKAVTGTEVIAEDGRTVQLDRMSRYEKVG